MKQDIAELVGQQRGRVYFTIERGGRGCPGQASGQEEPATAHRVVLFPR